MRNNNLKTKNKMEIQTIEIESIKFAKSIQKGVVQSYAKSGFYLASSEEDVLEDFVIVDIEHHLVHFICSLEFARILMECKK